jgi:hypothetical protein
MPNYLVLIYEDEAARAAAEASVIESVRQGHSDFFRENSDVLRGGARLDGGQTATSIRPRADGELTVTDGTFAETKEVLAGYYMIETDDLDRALATAKQIPSPFGGVEVRPVIPT